MGAGRDAQKGPPRSAKTKPSRAEDSPHVYTQAPLHPGAPLALLVARWRCLPKPAKGQPRRPKGRPKRRRATLKCPPASRSACAAPRRGTSRWKTPTASSVLGGARQKSTPRANMVMRSAGSAIPGWWRRCRTGRGCSCTLRGRYRCPRHFLDGVGRRARLGGVGLASRSPRRRGGSRRADFLSPSSERTMGLAERTACSNAPRAGTASASTSTCRASRSSSTRTTAATSR